MPHTQPARHGQFSLDHPLVCCGAHTRAFTPRLLRDLSAARYAVTSHPLTVRSPSSLPVSSACSRVNFRPRVPERLCETRKPSVYPHGVYSVVHAAGVDAESSLARRKCSQFAFTNCFGAVSQKRVAHVCAPKYFWENSPREPSPPTPTPVGGSPRTLL